jgi:hypothetical protein
MKAVIRDETVMYVEGRHFKDMYSREKGSQSGSVNKT